MPLLVLGIVTVQVEALPPAAVNILFIFVTLEVFQVERFKTKDDALAAKL